MCTKLRCAKRNAEMRIDMLIGNHLSASKGYAAMGKAALALDANTFAFFTRNPRGGKSSSSISFEKELRLEERLRS